MQYKFYLVCVFEKALNRKSKSVFLGIKRSVNLILVLKLKKMQKANPQTKCPTEVEIAAPIIPSIGIKNKFKTKLIKTEIDNNATFNNCFLFTMLYCAIILK